METQDITITGITYEVTYVQDYNSVEVYSVEEIDNPFLGTEDNPTYESHELYGYIEDILIQQYTDGLIYQSL